RSRRRGLPNEVIQLTHSTSRFWEACVSCNGGNMNSLLIISGCVRRAVIASILVSMLSLAAAAQNIDPRQEGRMYGDPGFVGEPINLNVVNADIRDILNYITEQYGINFVIDKS